ncbi:hypothetical protein DPX16_15016 [Anabarilius grahami]|uniref:Uncharacterized protein n=1 Tax=Anabarilius grahami TaxID=495550 RepID=A0A3N0YXL9_ANAGA|nr:hypothetical protein DPX16_15016 [Anabarilius grahami]
MAPPSLDSVMGLRPGSPAGGYSLAPAAFISNLVTPAFVSAMDSPTISSVLAPPSLRSPCSVFPASSSKAAICPPSSVGLFSVLLMGGGVMSHFLCVCLLELDLELAFTVSRSVSLSEFIGSHGFTLID